MAVILSGLLFKCPESTLSRMNRELVFGLSGVTSAGIILSVGPFKRETICLLVALIAAGLHFLGMGVANELRAQQGNANSFLFSSLAFSSPSRNWFLSHGESWQTGLGMVAEKAEASEILLR